MKNRKIYHQSNFPIFQNRMYRTAEEARRCPTGNISLIENGETGLIYNEAFIASLLDYDSSYQNEQSHSHTFKRHIEEVADLIENKIGRKKLIEIGCGKGTFLELLLSRGADVIGFDPAYEGSNPLIQRDYFTGLLKTKGDGLILRHVLEHIPEPVHFLNMLSKSNDGKGYIYIEVPCFDWIIKNGAWFDIFYEHVNYFRLVDFYRIFKNIIHSTHTFGGQYLSVIADLSSLRKPEANYKQTIDFPKDFNRLSKIRKKSDTNRNIVVWGGSSKGVIFSLLSERNGFPVRRIIDINPEKQGQYIPGTGLRVMSPAEGLKDLPKNSLIYVMNPNYLEEVCAMAGPNFICKGPYDD